MTFTFNEFILVIMALCNAGLTVVLYCYVNTIERRIRKVEGLGLRSN